MPRPCKDLEDYKDQILTWFQTDNLTIPEISAKLKGLGVDVHNRTVQRRCTQWDSRKRIRTLYTPELRQRVIHLFTVERLPDHEMLATLRNEGFAVQPIALKRLRKRLGCRRGPDIFKSLEELEQQMHDEPIEEPIAPESPGFAPSDRSFVPPRAVSPPSKSIGSQCDLFKESYLAAASIIQSGPQSSPSASNNLPTILFISLSDLLLNQTTCTDLLAALQSHARLLCVEKDSTAFQALTSSSLKIESVVLADPAVAHGKKQAELREKLFEYAEHGGTVVCAGVFARLIAPKDCNAFFHNTWKLPWTFSRDSYYLNVFRGEGLPGKELPENYNTKAISLKGVRNEDMVYVRRTGNEVREASVIFTNVGEGHLGYVGDVNSTSMSTCIVLGMLELG